MNRKDDNRDMGQGADFKIDKDGQWYHDGAPIKREALARLFSDRALKIDEEGRYWLQTPFEKYPVIVEDSPYVIVDFKVRDGVVALKSNMDEVVEVGANHPLELRYSKAYEMELPYIEIRNGLHARLGRNVYYALVEQFGTHIESKGVRFALGHVREG
jgi:uncharacterized protein